MKAIMFFFLSLIIVRVSDAQTYTIYTEELPPYNFTHNGKITGVSTEVVKKVMAKAGLKANIKSLSWQSAFQIARKEKNALIYSICRSKDREKMFKWIGVLTPCNYSAFGYASRKDIRIQELDDLKKYRIGTSIYCVQEKYLVSKGFKLSDFHRMGGENAHVMNLKKLINRRIDLWLMPDIVAYYMAYKEGYNPKQVIKKLWSLDELSSGYYLASSLNTPDSVVYRIKAALEKFKSNGEYTTILSAWGEYP